MRILSMTATFGKLDHETLTLTPGLNIIEAPNEWGKSTWCAFLVSMLYGMETRAKSTKTALADKERFLPWSGSPMAGSMDIHWNGRNITIQRKTKGRVPLGDFKAFETETGLAVPELTAANCGEMLLGVERSVFLRSSFIRHSDLPVGQDDALRRRLNALVTTGDESGDAEKLAKALKDLKNRCRYNRTGLLPQAEQEKQAIEATLRELETLAVQSTQFQQRLSLLKDQVDQLENHNLALAYAAAQEDLQRVAAADDAATAAVSAWEAAQAHCAHLPSRTEAEAKIARLDQLLQNRQELLLQQQTLPPAPMPPQAPQGFAGMDGDTALAAAREDGLEYRALSTKKPFAFLAAAVLVILGCLLWLRSPMAGVAAMAAGAVIAVFAIVGRNRKNRAKEDLARRYGSADPEAWLAAAGQYRSNLQAFVESDRACREKQAQLQSLLAKLEDQLLEITQNSDPAQCRQRWRNALSQQDRLIELQRDAQQAQRHAEALRAMAKPAPLPPRPDDLTLTQAQTHRMLTEVREEIHLLSTRLSQNQGRMDALGQPEELRRKLDKICQRIRKLEDTYAALTIAQDTLAQATLELQRKFAPQIAAHAQKLLEKMTGGRYNRLLLSEDLGLHTGSLEEDTLHDALWRSDGTADQMYLALRLAVAQALTPDAPLVLDDAMVRFDDDRLCAALSIFQEEAERKQILLFTCQSREKQLLSKYV